MVNQQMTQQKIDALRRVSQAEGQYGLAYMHAEHHSMMARLGALQSPMAADLAEQLQSAYVQYIDAIEAMANIERIEIAEDVQ